MIEWPIGLSTGCFYKTDFFECLPWIDQGGFHLLEICSYPTHLDYHDEDRLKRAATALRERHMEAFSFHAPFANHIDVTSYDPDERLRAEHELMQAVDAAARLEARYLVLHPGPESDQHPPTHERYDRLLRASEILRRVASRCAFHGFDIALENMLPHLLFGHVRDLLWLLGDIPLNNVGTCLDTGHAFLSGDLDVVLHKLSGHLRILHAHDNLGHRDDHLTPGDGHIDWYRLVKHLVWTRFHGCIILELGGRQPADPEKTLRAARRGRAHFKQQVRRYIGETGDEHRRE